MFTGIISDIGEVAAREGGHYTIRTRYPAASIAIGCSIACDGCCLTVTSVKPDGSGSLFAVDVSNETCSKTTLGSLEARPPRQSRAVTDRWRRAWRPYRDSGTSTVVAQIVDDHRRTATANASLSKLPEHLARYIAPKGSVALDGTSLTVNEVSEAPFRRQPHSAQLDGDDVGRENARRSGQSRSRCFRPLRGAADGVSPYLMPRAPTHVQAQPGNEFRRLRRSRRSSRRCSNGRMVILVDAEDRENEGDLVIPAQMATPDAINFMAKHGRGLICLALTQARAHELASRVDGRAPNALAQSHRLHRSRSRRAKASRPASRRTTARAPSRPPSIRPRAPPTSSRRAMSFRWSPAKAASWSAPATPKPPSISRGSPGSIPRPSSARS